MDRLSINEAKKNNQDNYNVWYDVAREKTEMDVVEWAIKAAELGAGEILLTSIDAEGMEKGMDIELIHKVAQAVDIPVIASGGFAKSSDFVEGVNAGADAIAVAKSLHYGKETIQNIKQFAQSKGILVR